MDALNPETPSKTPQTKAQTKTQCFLDFPINSRTEKDADPQPETLSPSLLVTGNLAGPETVSISVLGRIRETLKTDPF